MTPVTITILAFLSIIISYFDYILLRCHYILDISDNFDFDYSIYLLLFLNLIPIMNIATLLISIIIYYMDSINKKEKIYVINHSQLKGNKFLNKLFRITYIYKYKK